MITIFVFIRWVLDCVKWFHQNRFFQHFTSQTFMETLSFRPRPSRAPSVRFESVPLETVSEYCDRQTEKFKKCLATQEAAMNENMAALFYNKELFAEVNVDHEICRTMSSRILMENTPWGNIIMSFDAVKLCFTFYSDQHIASYSFLNAVAMKYCTLFRVLDFFVDEKYRVSPLLTVLKDSYYADNVLSVGVEKTFDPDYEFIKQNANLFRAGKSKTEVETATKRSMEEKMRNKFVCLGRVRDFHPLQTQNHSQESIHRMLFSDKPTGGGMFQEGKTLDWKSFKERKQG